MIIIKFYFKTLQSCTVSNAKDDAPKDSENMAVDDDTHGKYCYIPDDHQIICKICTGGNI